MASIESLCLMIREPRGIQKQKRAGNRGIENTRRTWSTDSFKSDTWGSQKLKWQAQELSGSVRDTCLICYSYLLHILSGLYVSKAISLTLLPALRTPFLLLCFCVLIQYESFCFISLYIICLCLFFFSQKLIVL